MIYSKEFLDKLENNNLRTQYVKIIVLDFDERPIREIQGQVQAGGSVQVNGSSSLRRTISLTMYADINTNNLTNIDNLISLNKKIKVSVGFKNTILEHQEYGEIIWFNCGTYVISSASISNSTTGSNISIQGRDKMVMLNGQVGGTIPMAIRLDQRQELDEEDEETPIISYPTIYQIIFEMISQFGAEPTTNIVISDLEQTGKALIKYIGQKELRLSKDLTEYKEVEVVDDKDRDTENYYYYKYGQDVGYQETDFTFPGELSFQAGSTVTQVLDKICQTFGNFEYFYDLDGRFIFQEKKNYLNKAYTPITELGSKNYIKQFSDSKYMYSFNDTKNTISLNLSPKYENIKNDYVIWGTRTSPSGISTQIRYHLALDAKPAIHLAAQYMYEIKKNDRVIAYEFYDKKVDSRNNAGKTLIGTPCEEWREELYRQALIRQKDGVTPNIYDMELLAEWRKQYDTLNSEWNETKHWNPEVYKSPGGLDYWLDLLDDGDDLRKYSCSAIGRRTKVVNSSNVTSIFNGEVQDVLFIVDDFETEKEKQEKIEELTNKGQKYLLISEEDYNLFSLSATGASAFDVMRDTIYQGLTYNSQVSITCTPKYYFEPNNLIYIANTNNGVSGSFVVSQFTLPLNYNGTMNITATEAFTRI